MNQLFEVFPRLLNTTQIESILKLPTIDHHSDEGHIGQEKNLFLPQISHTIGQALSKYDCLVDERMKLYQLQDAVSAVPLHVDEDFIYKNKLALYSVLVYLNDSYTGGETVFNGNIVVPHLEKGSVLVFKHDIPHEGRAVKSGTKFVLKTDLLF